MEVDDKRPGYRRLTGDTYPVRIAIQGLGGIYDRPARAWWVPESRYEEARRLVKEMYDRSHPSNPANPKTGPLFRPTE